VQPIDLPAAFHRFREIGGVLEFAVFDGIQGDRESALDAICATLPDADKNKLRALGYRCIDDRTFFGDWYNDENRLLLRIGSYSTSDGRTLTDPALVDLEGVKITHGGGPIPEPGDGGQFAYAFSWTPYGLQARRTQVQALFDAIRDSSCLQTWSTKFWTGPILSFPRFRRFSPRAWSGGVSFSSLCMYRKPVY